MSSTLAIVEVAKVYQKEHEHIRVYTSKFEELHRFFKDILTKEAVIGLLLNNIRKSLKVHAVGIKRSKPSWDAFLREITRLNNEEPQEVSLVKGGFWKPVLALEVEKASNSPKEIELELMKEIEELKKRLRNIEVPFKERKSFQSDMQEAIETEQSVLHVAGWGILPEIAESKRTRSNQGRKFSKK